MATRFIARLTAPMRLLHGLDFHSTTHRAERPAALRWRSTFKKLALGGGFDTYCLSVDVDPTTPAIVYLSGLSLFKAIVDPFGFSGYSSDIGQNIHADHHAFAFDRADSQVIYAGTDGGISRSADGG